MPRKKKPVAKEEHTHLAIRIDGYDVNLEAAVNRYAYDPRYAFRDPSGEPLYPLSVRLVIAGTCTYPKDRAGNAYEVTIYGDDARVVEWGLKLKDIPKTDERGARQYRSYRGKQIPVYDPPPGIGHLEKTRGESAWTAWVWCSVPFANGLVVLLGQHRELFLAIHECRVQRDRFVRSLTLQTSDPASE